MTRRSMPPVPDHLRTRSVEGCLRTVGAQLALCADVLRLHAQTDPDDGLRPDAMHALASLCDTAQADVAAVRRRLPGATLNMPAPPGNG